MARLTKDQRRLLVAHSLLHLDILWRLDVDELVEWLGIEAQGDGYFADREELRKLLVAASEIVLSKLAGSMQFDPHVSLLKAVLAGTSINQWATQRHLSREHVSRTHWLFLTTQLTRELEGLRKTVYITGSAKIRPRD